MDPYQEKTDEEIAALVQKGEKDAFGILMERYEKKIFRYGKKFLSDHSDVLDISQDVFMNAYRNIQGFDLAQRFSPWIYRIAHNAFVNELKKKSHRPLRVFDFDTLVSHVVYDDPDTKEREQKELRQILDTGLDRVPAKYKEVLILYYEEELGYKEISEILQIPQGTVGIRLMRGKDILKEHMKEWL
jgi:RNA polymerase sigma-70 factor (ECF subfamily)